MLKILILKLNNNAAELKKCKDDFVYFIEKYVKIPSVDVGGYGPIKLRAFQKNAISKMRKHRFLFWLTSRQVGKTNMLLMYILWKMLFNKDVRVMYLSTKNETSKWVCKRFQEMFDNLPEWLKLDYTIKSKFECEFTNGSRVQFAPSTLCGMWTPDILVLDEAAFYENFQGFWEAVWPTISRKKDSKVLIATTGSKNQPELLTNLWNSEHFEILKTMWYEVDRYNLQGDFDPHFFELEMADLIGEESFEWEFCCKMPEK